MGFGATPKDSAGIPISSVYIPDVGFIALQGSPNTKTDGSLNESTAALLALGASSYASGTLQNAQTGSAAGTPLNVLGMASVVFTVNMVGFTGTVTFKASEDGTNYDPINVTQAGTSTIGSTAVGSTATSIHCYDASIAGYQSIEAVTSGVSAGNVTVTAHALPINIAPRVVNIAGSITATNPSVGTDGSAIPTSSTLVGASDGTNLQQLLVESASNRNLRVGIYNGANEVAVDASGRLTLVPNQGVEIVDSGGTNKLSVDSSGRLTLIPNSSVNIAQWNGAAPSVTNPVITEDQIRSYVANGNAYSATSGKQTTINGTMACGIANASGSGKNVLVYSIRMYSGSTTTGHVLNSDTDLSNIGTPTSITVVNKKIGSSAGVATASFSSVNQTPHGTTIDSFGEAAANNEAELLTNGDYYLLPSGSSNALVMYVSSAAASNSWGVTFKYIEY